MAGGGRVEKKEKQKKNDGNKVKQRIKGRESNGFCKRAVPRFDKQTHHSAWLHSQRFLITVHILIKTTPGKKKCIGKYSSDGDFPF